MSIRFLKEKIYQIFLVLMTLAFIGMSIFSITKVLQVHELQRQLYGCKNTHVDHYIATQGRADTKSKEYETIRTENQVTNNVVEKQLETIIQKEPVVFYTDCISSGGLSELTKHYDTYPASEPSAELPKTDTATRNKGS